MTDLAFTIRSAKADDLETLNDLMYELHQYHHQAVPEDFKSADEVQQEKSIARYLDSPECLVLVLTVDGAEPSANPIVGFITAQFCELLSPISRPCLVGNIDELFVLPSYRQHGYGQALLAKAELRLRELGASQILVEVWDFNQAALDLYKKEGFFSHIHCLRKKI
ncbi:GNAT family N-acetyltransferase [Vibrio methylphosphonaticus]|uniref:GNAT family N-acetyltransferase n=1 Tax=Vibrio methylphosphonaticus TaxID=2946866 RepID=UPI00202A046E|nr:N-acetyltransferase [Vibrio methylphosphonaticus]MCL9774944.1 GNAT family N-acetyltransferase [Vibrio methylphosphonaticus]